MITGEQAAEIAADTARLYEALRNAVGPAAQLMTAKAMPALVRNVLDGPVAAQDEPPHP